MKNHESESPLAGPRTALTTSFTLLGGADPLRRKLLFGMPGGLVMLTPMAMFGCGGGGDAATAEEAVVVRDPAVTGGVVVRDSGRAMLGATTMTETAVTVEVPAGVSLPVGDLVAFSATGGFEAVVAGRSKVRQLLGTPQWTTVLTSEGLPLLFGYVGGANTALSAHSTATVLLAFATGADMSWGLASAARLDALRAHPATALLAHDIASALAADRHALAAGSPVIANAVSAAARAILPHATVVRAKPLFDAPRLQGISINPPNASSGLQPIIGEPVNTVYVQNEKLRRAYYVIRREGHVDASGATIVDSARPVIASGDMTMPPGFDSAGSIIGSVTEAGYSGDPTALGYSKTPEVMLPVTPEGAKRTKYSVVVLTAGNAGLGYDPDAYAKLSDDEKKKIDITLFAPENLALRQLFIDMLVPLFLNWLGGKIGDEQKKQFGPREYKEKLEVALFGQILGLFQATLPEIAAKYRDPKNYPGYGPVGALRDIVSKHLVTFVDFPLPGGKTLSVPALSKFSISMVVTLLKYLAYEKMSNLDGEAVLAFLEGKPNPKGGLNFSWVPPKEGGPPRPVWVGAGDMRFAGMGAATACLSLVDDALGLLSQTRMLADMGTSRLLESWEIQAVKPNLKLTPRPFEVDPIGGTFPLHAEIIDNDNDAYGVEKGSFSYDWVCVARGGDLLKRNFTAGAEQEKNIFTTSNANATADFLPNGMTPQGGVADTVKVTAYFEPIGSSKPRELLGTASTTILYKKAFNLGINPVSPTDVPADSSMGVTAFVKETLPEGSTAAWEWSHSGVGSIEAVPADSNPGDSSVTFKTTSSEGSATITARATITTPATATKAARIVLTDPISTTLNVKKGLKTITVEGYFQLEPSSKPLAVPQCFFDGVGKEACHLGYLDTWVTYIVPKVANAKSYLIKLLGPTGNAVYTYDVPSRYPIGGPVIRDGGGTLRIRFWASDSPYGSYDGVSNYGTTQAAQSAYLLGRARNELPRVVAVVTLNA